MLGSPLRVVTVGSVHRELAYSHGIDGAVSDSMDDTWSAVVLIRKLSGNDLAARGSGDCDVALIPVRLHGLILRPRDAKRRLWNVLLVPAAETPAARVAQTCNEDGTGTLFVECGDGEGDVRARRPVALPNTCAELLDGPIRGRSHGLGGTLMRTGTSAWAASGPVTFDHRIPWRVPRQHTGPHALQSASVIDHTNAA
jgi:hypothetical protein